MKHILLVAVLALILAGCVFPTVRATPEEYAAWQAMHQATVEAAPALPTVTPGPDMSPECNIKVNFNGTEWVYHMPDGVYYERTLIEPDKGEFFACTEAEAQAHGARKALR